MDALDHSEIYQRDFFQWLMEQADALRRRNIEALDFGNLAEEVESLGRSQLRELKSHLRIILIHLLKWQCQPQRRSRSWSESLSNQRQELDDLLEMSPSLRGELIPMLEKVFSRSRKRAASQMKITPEEAMLRLPSENPWTIEQILDLDFYPAADSDHSR